MRRFVLLAIPSLLLGSLVVSHDPSAAAAGDVSVLTTNTIAVTQYDSVFIGGDGKVYGTGRNDLGIITGSGQRTEPAPLTGLPAGVRADAVAGAPNDLLVKGSNGSVYGSGAGEDGEITGTSNESTLTKLTGLPAGVKATAIAAGGSSSLVLGSNGKVYGTGDNSDDQLTTGAPFDATTLTPLVGMGAVQAVAIAEGLDYTVVLGADGRVYGAGLDEFGELTGPPSAGTFVQTLTPFAGLPFGVHMVAIAAGSADVVMLSSDGTAYATGDNQQGEFGLGTTDTDTHTTPVALPVSNVVGVSSGLANIGLILKGGLVVVAGYNPNSQLTGTTSPVDRFQPLALSADVPATGSGTELALGSFTTLVRDSLGIVYGAGDNSYGELTGTAETNYPQLTVLGGQKVVNTTAPTVVGTLKVGHTLAAHAGSWRVSASHYAYQWLRNGAAIHGATSSTYKLVKADKKKKIAVHITATRTGFASGTATSAGRAPVGA